MYAEPVLLKQKKIKRKHVESQLTNELGSDLSF